MDLTLLEALRTARDLGAYGALGLAIVGGFRGWYVWRWQYDQEVARGNEWQRVAMLGLGIAEKAVKS